MKIVLTLGILFLAGTLGPISVPAAETGPLWSGLAEELPSDYLERSGFVEFQESFPHFSAPFIVRVTLNGQTVPPQDIPTLSKLLEERTYARVPAGIPIRRELDRQGQEIWSYPSGTEVAHEIRWKSMPSTLFELRIVKKLDDGTWAFGVYSPSQLKDALSPLRLHTYSGLKQDSVVFTQASSGEKMDVQFSRINLQSCRGCHFVSTRSKNQFSSVKETGPCGFVPALGAETEAWAERYRARAGFQPITASPSIEPNPPFRGGSGRSSGR